MAGSFGSATGGAAQDVFSLSSWRMQEFRLSVELITIYKIHNGGTISSIPKSLYIFLSRALTISRMDRRSKTHIRLTLAA